MPNLKTDRRASSLPRLHDPVLLPAELANPVVAIGNFDGVHRGHRRVFAQTLALARRLGRPAAVLTFSPHPRLFFQPGALRFELTPSSVQSELLAGIGMDGVIVLSFDASLAALTAEEFINEILIKRLKVSAVVAGADFHFGKGRTGSPETLKASGKAHGFAVEIVDQLADGDTVISSTLIRDALAAGEIAAANAMLGYDWFIRGEVIHGEKRGRELGYPTANIRLAPGCQLKHGIYAVRMRLDGQQWPAVASFGRRPTFDNGAPLLEVHVFDFSESLYGKTPEIVFVRYLRDELKFDSVEALVRQMNADSAEAMAVLAAKQE